MRFVAEQIFRNITARNFHHWSPVIFRLFLSILLISARLTPLVCSLLKYASSCVLCEWSHLCCQLRAPAQLRVHRDAVQSALNLIGRICARVEIPANAQLTALFSHSMQFVSDGALRCYQNLIDSHLRRGSCGEWFANPATVDFFSTRLRSLVCHLETALFADRLAVSSSSSGPQQVGAGSDRGAGGSAGLHRSANLRRESATAPSLRSSCRRSPIRAAPAPPSLPSPCVGNGKYSRLWLTCVWTRVLRDGYVNGDMCARVLKWTQKF